MDYNHNIFWDNVKTLKSESRTYRRCVAESFLINQKARLLNAINRNDGANFQRINDDLCIFKYHTFYLCPPLVV